MKKSVLCSVAHTDGNQSCYLLQKSCAVCFLLLYRWLCWLEWKWRWQTGFWPLEREGLTVRLDVAWFPPLRTRLEMVMASKLPPFHCLDRFLGYRGGEGRLRESKEWRDLFFLVCWMILRIFEDKGPLVQYFVSTFPEEVGPLAIIKLIAKGNVWKTVIEGFGWMAFQCSKESRYLLWPVLCHFYYLQWILEIQWSWK